jgi:hypothetical protein
VGVYELKLLRLKNEERRGDKGGRERKASTEKHGVGALLLLLLPSAA